MTKVRKIAAILGVHLVLLGANNAIATVSAATGFSSTTSGRRVPALAIAWNQETWSMTATTVGIAAPLYYHSAWTLSAFKVWKGGEFGRGLVTAGLGAGLFYARRGYRDTEFSPLQTATDFNLGPAFRITWNFLDPAFFSVECMFGLRNPLPLIVLSAQDTAIVTVGVAF